MVDKVRLTLSLICALAPIAVFGQQARVTKFDGGYFTGSIVMRERGGVSGAGEQIALFFDPSRTKIRAFALGKASADDVLKSVAANADKLHAAMALARAFSENYEFEGKLAKQMLHIIVFPKKVAAVTDDTAIKKPLSFQPGALKSLKELKQRFGEPGEQQLWSAETAQVLGLNGIVCWWGTVGVAAAGDGSITHVLLRAEPEK